MSDLISRQAAQAIKVLPKCYREYKTGNLDDAYDEGWEDAMQSLNALPTIDPVKHGKWESNEYLYTTGQTRCSSCKTEYYVGDLLNVGEGAQEYLPNCCPHCGARMDGE